ncbi:NAD(P)-dependent oxidoreductase [Psychromonas sp. L1A2]|uniref:NAD(P)-dependent oxidoreductase n=1 Tax=Psychromonas sp. L1A2 TaxID=2686356 RepID=UPI0013585719|nr:NAD(P)-dependent oxidoreductase [Psychromonas sp. L1A2]
MSNGLIGYTGFVGENIKLSIPGELMCYNSSNINDIKGTTFDILYISAIQAKKWWANQNPEEDKNLIDQLFGYLESVEAKKVVFISTVDVYQPPLNANEDTSNNKNIHAYGANRLYAEERAAELFEDLHIIRLQGLVADNLSKNIVFDLKNKNILETLNPDSSLQWYPLKRLYSDIENVIKNKIPLINLSVEPIKTQSIIDIAPLTIEERKIVSTQPANYVSYDVKSKYAKLMGGDNGYIVNAQESLTAIKSYFES